LLAGVRAYLNPFLARVNPKPTRRAMVDQTDLGRTRLDPFRHKATSNRSFFPG
jgi:hypothetical protein